MKSQKKPSQNPDADKKQLQLEYSFSWNCDLENRVIRITGEIEEGSFDHLDACLSELESRSRKAITIRINSPGGEVYEALAMVGRIKSSKCKIVTEGYGHIMSAAVAVLAAGDRRRMSRYAWFMHHEVSYEGGGKHSEMKNIVVQQEAEEAQWASIMEEFTEADKEFWLHTGRHLDLYMSAEECLEHGVVDELF